MLLRDTCTCAQTSEIPSSLNTFNVHVGYETAKYMYVNFKMEICRITQATGLRLMPVLAFENESATIHTFSFILGAMAVNYEVIPAICQGIK